MFDGSAIAGWRDVSQSDMLLKPDLDSAVLDPFSAQPSLILIGNVAEPSTGLGYERCPRSVAERAEAHLVASGLADRAQIAPQAEFFVFDDVRFASSVQEAFWRVDAEEGPYNSGTRYETGNRGHRPQSGARRSPCRRSISWPTCAPRWSRCSRRWASMPWSSITIPRRASTSSASASAGCGPAPTGCRSTNTWSTASPAPTARPPPSCPSRWRSSRARGCRSSRRCGRATSRCSPARAMPTCPSSACTTSAASSTTRARSTRSPTRPPTATGGWSRAAARRASWPMPRSTGRPRSGCRSPPGRSTSGSRCASPTPPPTPTSPSPRC